MPAFDVPQATVAARLPWRPWWRRPMCRLRAVLLAVLWLAGACESAADHSGSAPDTQVASSRESAPRIVSLHDVSSEVLVGLGLVGALVGVETLVDPTPELRTQLEQVPRVSSLESLIALNPSHAVGLEVTRKRNPQLVQRLEQLGVTVVLGNPTSLTRSVDWVRQVAKAFDRELEGEQLVAPLVDELASDPAERIEPEPGRRPRVFVYDCCQPPFSAGGGGLLNELLTRAGATNVFGDLPADWASVSWESVVDRRPELIVIHAYNYQGQKDVESKRNTLRAVPGLREVPTVALPLGCSLGGLRSVEGLRRLRQAVAGLRL